MHVDELLRSTGLPPVPVDTDDALSSTVRRGRTRRRQRTALLGTCTVLAVGGLAAGAAVVARDDSPEVAVGPSGPAADPATAEPHECEAAEGAVTDLASEPPEWREASGGGPPWTDRDGCLVRMDVLAESPGPDHCGYERATVLTTGQPVGTPFSTMHDDRQYVRDPDGVYGDPALAAAFDPDATLPPTAVDSGFRRDGVELWHDPADPSAVWLVGPDRTERWPAGEPAICE
jgi:hypothetical protein